jgi:hypothetical protein
MLTRKVLRRSHRKQAAAPPCAPALRRALKSRLACTARWSADEGERAAAARALAVLTAHAWQDSGFDERGVPVPRRPGKPVTPLGGAR